MRSSSDGKTIGITLRLDKEVYDAYSKIAARANLVEIKNGRHGGVTVQDVLRHRLASLPLLKDSKKGSK